jgi:hypothetical protein
MENRAQSALSHAHPDRSVSSSLFADLSFRGAPTRLHLLCPLTAVRTAMAAVLS